MGSQSLCAEAIGTDSIMRRLCNFTGWMVGRENVLGGINGLSNT